MRSDLELLSLIHYNLQTDKYLFTLGLCQFVSTNWECGVINKGEYQRLNEIIKQHKPESKLSWQLWWCMGVRKPRIVFLRKLIKKYAKSTMS